MSLLTPRQRKGGPKLKSREQVQAAQDECYKRWLQGESQRDIARSLEVSVVTVNNNLRKARSQVQWDIEAERDRTIHRIEWLIKTATEAWERSQTPIKSETVTVWEDGETHDGQAQGNEPTGRGGRCRRSTRTDHQHGDPAYLEQIQKAIKQGRMLLGLDMPRKIALTDPEGVRELSGGGLSALIAFRDALARDAVQQATEQNVETEDNDTDTEDNDTD